jgi:hypothetical protein
MVNLVRAGKWGGGGGDGSGGGGPGAAGAVQAAARTIGCGPAVARLKAATASSQLVRFSSGYHVTISPDAATSRPVRVRATVTPAAPCR